MNQFINTSETTVTDTTTNLVWTKKTVAVDVDHKTAEQLVADLGEGFRLPTVAELFGLVDHSKCTPAINTEFFQDIENDWYWTSTPCAWNSAAVWVVNFGGGSVDDNHRSGGACVLAVRSSQ